MPVKLRTLRVPEGLDRVLRIAAAEVGVSVHQYILEAVKRDLEEPLETSPLPAAYHEVETPTGTVVIPEILPIQVQPLACTCGPGEKVKGKHNRYCPVAK